MRVTAHETVEWELRLTDDEAMWLLGLLQNPISEDEKADCKIMRESMFNALCKEGVTL